MNAITENLKGFIFIGLLLNEIVYKANEIINIDINIPKNIDDTLVKNIKQKGTPTIPEIEGRRMSILNYNHYKKW
jgi:hypothetical protein